MIRQYCFGKFQLMTPKAVSRNGFCLLIAVTGSAVNGLMRADQTKISLIVIERGRFPTCVRVTFQTIFGKSHHRMIRGNCFGKFFLMTEITILRYSFELSVHMA